MDKMNKIVYVSGSHLLGGGEISLLTLLEGLDRSCWEPVVIVPGKGLFQEKVNDLAISTHELDIQKFRKDKLLEFLGSVHDLTHLLARENARIVHVNSLYCLETAYFAARWLNLPLVYHARDLYPCLNGGSVRLYAMRRCSAVVAISQKVATDLVTKLSIPIPRIKTIPNGVSMEKFDNAQNNRSFREQLGLNGDYIVGLFGRIAADKGQLVLVEAIERLRQQGEKIHALIVGDAFFQGKDYLDKLRVNINRKNLDNHVTMTGYRDDIPLLMQAVDLVVIPSDYEPFGRVAIEALAAGKPVIASRCGGLPEIIEDGVSGALVPPRDPESLAESIKYCKQHEDVALKMGGRGKELVGKKFSKEHHVKMVTRLYEDLLNRV